MVAGSVAFLWLGHWMTGWDQLKAQVIGWLSMVLCMAIGLVALIQLFGPAVVVILNNQGIEDRRLGMGLVLWEDVAAVEIRSHRGSEFLCIDLVDEAKYRSRMSLFRLLRHAPNKLLGFPLMTITFFELDGGLSEARDYCDRVLRARQRARIALNP